MNILTTEFGTYVFFVIALLFVIQFVLIFAGSDFDFDTDFDASDMFSFKGITHFLLGFSIIWALYGINTIYFVGGAILTGLIFVFSLGYIYKFIYKKLSNEIKPETNEDLINRTGKIYIVLDNENAIIKTIVNGAEREIEAKFNLAYEDDSKPQCGDPVKIIDVRNGRIIIECE